MADAVLDLTPCARLRALVAPVVLAFTLASLHSACAGPSKSSDFKPLPERLTRATVVGPLCDGNLCRCIEPGSDPGLPEREDVKRYQFLLGPTANEMWVEVGDMVLYKGVERATDCFIIDLTTTKHPVVVRASGEHGFAVGLSIREIGKHSMYETFDFQCGGPDPCTFDAVDEFKSSLARYKRGVHDPCGSTRIRGLEWLTGGSTDRVHPGDLQLSLVLDSYDFTPEHPSGDPACKDRY